MDSTKETPPESPTVAIIKYPWWRVIRYFGGNGAIAGVCLVFYFSISKSALYILTLISLKICVILPVFLGIQQYKEVYKGGELNRRDLISTGLLIGLFIGSCMFVWMFIFCGRLDADFSENIKTSIGSLYGLLYKGLHGFSKKPSPEDTADFVSHFRFLSSRMGISFFYLYFTLLLSGGVSLLYEWVMATKFGKKWLKVY